MRLHNRRPTGRDPIRRGNGARPSLADAVYRFLLSPRWLGWAALALVGVVVFVALGAWQFDRARRVTLPVQAAHPDAVAQPLAGVVRGGTVDAATAGRVVSVTGTWDVAAQVVVPGAKAGGRSVERVVTPLLRASGPAVLVVRGLVAEGTAVPAAPAGTVAVTGWLAGSEPPPQVSPALAPGELAAVSTPLFLNRVGYPLLDGYLGLTRAEPAASAAGLATVPLPGGRTRRVDWSWQSLGYAVQWNVFALGAIAALVIAARQHARDGRVRAAAERGSTEVSF